MKNRAPHKIGCKCNVCKLKRGEPHKVDCNCIACRLIRGEGKNKGNPNYKHGKYIKRKCTICNKLLSPLAKICGKHRITSLATRKKMRLKATGRIVSIETRKKHSIISKKRWGDKKYRAKMSLIMSKVVTKLWQDKSFREKIVQASLKGLKLKPNRPEKILIKLLNKLFPKRYEYVGDGSVILNGFNPDFINKKEKKIIEHYGDYWHNKPNAKEKDKRRLKTYKKYGYKTLIIWEEELKDIIKLMNKIIKFQNT